MPPTNNLTLYSAPLIPHKQMVWWYQEIHEQVDRGANLIGGHTSFIDQFIIDTSMRCAARLLRNRTIFQPEDEVRKMGGRKKGKFIPRETLLIRIGMDFIYHEIVRPEDTPSPFEQHRERIPFVHAVYILLIESFLRTTNRYCDYVEESAKIRIKLMEGETDRDMVMRLSQIELKATSIERKTRASRGTLYGVVKQVKWHTNAVEWMRDAVIISFQRLAMQLAKRYGRSEQQILDNFQHGSTGLVRAANYFDPHREKAFSGLARNWIQAAILLHLKTEANMCKIPAPIWQLSRKIEQVAHGMGIRGDNSAIAKAMNMKVEEIEEVQRMIQINRPVSLENPVSDDEPTTTLKDNIKDKGVSPEDSLIETSEDLSDYMRSLTYDERVVVCCLFGTYEQIPETVIPAQVLEAERMRQVAAQTRLEMDLVNV